MEAISSPFHPWKQWQSALSHPLAHSLPRTALQGRCLSQSPPLNGAFQTVPSLAISVCCGVQYVAGGLLRFGFPASRQKLLLVEIRLAWPERAVSFHIGQDRPAKPSMEEDAHLSNCRCCSEANGAAQRTCLLETCWLFANGFYEGGSVVLFLQKRDVDDGMTQNNDSFPLLGERITHVEQLCKQSRAKQPKSLISLSQNMKRAAADCDVDGKKKNRRVLSLTVW